MDLNHTLSQSVIYKPVSLNVQTAEGRYLQQRCFKTAVKATYRNITQNSCNVMYKNQKTFILLFHVLYNLCFMSWLYEAGYCI